MKKSSLIILTSVLCLTVSIITAVCAFFITRAFVKPAPTIKNEKPAVAVSGDGEEFYDGGVYNMPQTLSFSGNVMPLADASAASAANGEVTLTATVTPAGASVVLSWSVAFKNPSSAWASGKSAATYVSVQPVIGTLSAKVTCNAAFGEQIVITAADSKDSTKKATCICDYAKKPKTVAITLDNNKIYNNLSFTYENMNADNLTSTGKIADILTNADGVVGTIKDEVELQDVKFCVVDGFRTKFDSLYKSTFNENVSDNALVESLVNYITVGEYSVVTEKNGNYEYENLSAIYSFFCTICPNNIGNLTAPTMIPAFRKMVLFFNKATDVSDCFYLKYSLKSSKTGAEYTVKDSLYFIKNDSVINNA